MRQVGRSSQRILWRQSLNKFEFVLFCFSQTVGFCPAVFCVVVAGKRAGGRQVLQRIICDMESEDYGMAALEEWVTFFEEKSCEEWVGVADLRLRLKDAYMRVRSRLWTGSEEKEAMLHKALALGEELKKFKPHPEDPMPWLEGTHRVVRETAEMVRGLVDKAEDRRLEREEQERMQRIWTGLLVMFGLIGFWAVLRQERRIKKQTRLE